MTAPERPHQTELMRLVQADHRCEATGKECMAEPSQCDCWLVLENFA